MRLGIVLMIVVMCLGQLRAEARDGLPDPGARSTWSITSILPADSDFSGDRLVFLGAGAVAVVIVVNYMSGGMVGALLGTGRANVSVLSIVAFAASEISWHGTVWGLGPAAIISVGQPVDAALRDGFTTPSSLAAAFVESGRRAGALVVNGGSYVGATVADWWKRL